MKLANNIMINVHIHDEEDEQIIKKTFIDLIPFNLEKEKISLKKEIVKGFDEKKIFIYKIMLSKDRHINLFLDKINDELNDDEKKRLIDECESRTNDECEYFLRLDKDKLTKTDKCKITDSGNCFHVKINLALFPKKRENAKEHLRKIFKLTS